MIRAIFIMALSLPVATVHAQTAPLDGRWTGEWASKTTNAGGELELQFSASEGDSFPAKIRQTRPDNANWRCSEKLDDIQVRRGTDGFTFDYSPGGRCRKTTHSIKLQDGKLVGTYKTDSGAESEYVLRRQ